MEQASEPIPLPRSILMLDAAIGYLHLRALPPFSMNLGLCMLALGTGLLLPRQFARLAGSLLAMQALVIMAIGTLLCLLLVRQAMRRNPNRETVRSDEKGWTWMVDYVLAFFLITAFATGGIFGPLEFIVLAGATFIGVARGEHGAREIADVGGRAAVALCVLTAVAVLFQLPKIEYWAGASNSVTAAGVYFGALALAEAAGLFAPLADRLLKLAQWAQHG